MSNRKLCGYDLNGWCDRAARNWQIRPDGEESISSDGCFVGGMVVHPSIVRTGKDKQVGWVGGAQAALAPHGRGAGWGDVGDRSRRTSVRTILNDQTAPSDQMAAALAGLAAGARVCAISIDDHPSLSENLQERLLAAVARGRLGRGLLVWRSVLSVLGCLTMDRPLLDASDDMVVGVIGHVAQGFTVQRLRIRREAGQGRQVFAPERRRVATAIDSAMGYEGLASLARKTIVKANPDHRGDWVDHAKLPFDIALGLSGAPELFRNERGDFFEVTPPKDLFAVSDDLPADLANQFAGCHVVLFESLTQGSVRSSIVAAITARFKIAFLDLPGEIVARGALEAARRHAEGEPVYFDFLPQISTIVWGEDGAANYDLIETDATLPAGRLYRSPKPAQFAIQGGQSGFAVHLRKELSDWPRRALVDIGQKVSSPVPVSLSVEQAPAAGRAQLIIDAPALSRQFLVDWETADDIQKPWDEVIAELDAPSATIPARMVLPCGTDAWEDSPKGPGLATLLEENDGRKDVDWAALADKLAQGQQRRYCISSDGEIPSGISADLVAKLDGLTERALQHLQDRVAGRISDDDKSLKFLTWQFRRCPKEIQGLLMDAIAARSNGRADPLIKLGVNWVLIHQGFGRICRDSVFERRVFHHLLARPITAWKFREETAAAAFILSRSETAPLLLERRNVEQLAARVLLEFRGELGGNYTKFIYAPFLLGGLIRWRLKDRNALVIGLDPLAERLRAAIQTTLNDFERRRNRNETVQRAATRYAPLLVQLLDWLQRQGGNPNLLIDLYES